MSLVSRDVGPAHMHPVKAASFAKGGVLLVSFDSSGYGNVYEMATKMTKEGHLEGNPNTVKGPMWMDEEGGTLLTTRPHVTVFDVDSMKAKASLRSDRNNNVTVTAVAMLDEHRAVVCDSDGSVTLWDISDTDKDTAEQELLFGDHVKQDSDNYVVAVATYGNRIYANTRRASVLTWDLDIGLEAISGISTFVDTTTDSSAVPFFAVSHDEKFGVISMAKVSVLNLEAGYTEGEFSQNDSEGYATCYDMRENEIAIGYSLGTCILWGFRNTHCNFKKRIAIGTPEPYSNSCLAVALSRDQSKMFAVRTTHNSNDMYISTYDLKVQEKRAASLLLMHWMRLNRDSAFNIMTSTIVEFLVTAEAELLPGQLARVRCLDTPGLIIPACIIEVKKKTSRRPEFCSIVTLPLCEPVPKALADTAGKRMWIRTTDLTPMPESEISKMEKTKQRELRFDIQKVAKSLDPRLRDRVVAETDCDIKDASRALRQCNFSIEESVRYIQSNKHVKDDKLEKLLPEYEEENDEAEFYEDDGSDEDDAEEENDDGGGLVEMPSFSF
eukprot:TRINITY_DN5713_c0_g1_i1.p1 TRINITY_DN5713_c0_g1~~TRINITY_DN5713_c0_g1_i1.p1  ORF type:complete len:553 (+),score=126.08 TRINITY_DN5713_c0_g1_i1:41-1699(+)